MTSAGVKSSDGGVVAKEGGEAEHVKKEPEKKKRQYAVDQDLLRAFRYFDRTGEAADVDMCLPQPPVTICTRLCMLCLVLTMSDVDSLHICESINYSRTCDNTRH